METFEDERGLFGPNERIQMRDAGIRIEVPEPAVNPICVGDAVQPPIDLDGGLAHYPGEEPQHMVKSRFKDVMHQIRMLSENIANTDAITHSIQVQRMAETRADLTRQIPDAF